VRPDELERRLRARLDALGPAPRAELLHVLMLPDFERADRIGEFWGSPGARAARRAGGRGRAGNDVDRTGRALRPDLEIEIGRQRDGTIDVISTIDRPPAEPGRHSAF
jgi:hypothetical protein